MEKICKKHGRVKHYKRKTGGPLCSKCSTEYKRGHRRREKARAIEYKGGSCIKCGYNKSSAALEFHHLDPSVKDFQISRANKSWETIKKELDKCVLLCANCHRELHERLESKSC